MTGHDGKKTILLVDDSRTVLLTTKIVLRRYHVVTASNGKEGLDMALADPPDLVLLDVVMPQMDGFEVCRRLREHDGFTDLPVIMLTTRGEPDNVETGFTSGCTEYVTKPFDASVLLAKIRNFIGE